MSATTVMVPGMSEAKLLATMDGLPQTWTDPSEDQLRDFIAELNLRHQFLIVERLDAPNDEYYMQIRISEDLGRFDIEYRDGGADAHFRAEMARENGSFAVYESIGAVLVDWAFERGGWREALPWRRWDPATEAPVPETPAAE